MLAYTTHVDKSYNKTINPNLYHITFNTNLSTQSQKQTITREKSMPHMPPAIKNTHTTRHHPSIIHSDLIPRISLLSPLQ